MWNSIVSVSDRYLFIYFHNYVNVTLFIMLRARDRVLSVQVRIHLLVHKLQLLACP